MGREMIYPTYTGGTAQPTTSRKHPKRAKGTAPPAVKPTVIGTEAQPTTKLDGAPPVDPTLVAQQNAANTSVALGDAWDTYQQGQVGATYGNLDNPAADLASNPYSLAALKLQAFNNQTRGTLNSYASHGQLYAGSLQNAQEANVQGYNQGLDALKKRKQSALDALTKGKLDRYSQVGATLDQNTLTALLKALGA